MHTVVERIDDFGKPAWIAVMVLAFILFWPLGLAILAYLIWSGRMACGRHGDMAQWQQRMAENWRRQSRTHPATGNAAFDEYREEVLKRLEDEAREFRGYLERLRMAKDKAEFDQFMAERRGQGASGGPNPTQ